MPQKLLNKSIFFWCCKPLGLQTLWHLVALKVTDFPDLQLTGIGLSSKDSLSPEIKRVALAHWPNCAVNYDKFELTVAFDLGLCVGFPFKISPATLMHCTNGAVNLHFAPLPKYRGSGTLEHAILNQDDRYGVTLHYMDAGLDTGEVIDRAWCPLPPNASYLTMVPKIEKLGNLLLKKWLPTLLTKVVIGIPQTVLCKQEQITPLFCTRKSISNLYKLNRSRSFSSLYRYVRALDKGPGKRPYFEHNGKQIFLSSCNGEPNHS